MNVIGWTDDVVASSRLSSELATSESGDGAVVESREGAVVISCPDKAYQLEADLRNSTLHRIRSDFS